MNKIFCIGMHKTGTVSIATALEKLGFNVKLGDKSDSERMEKNLHEDRLALHGYEQYDAFADLYCPKECFSIFDRQYPDSRFILTVRNEKDWIRSCWNQIKKRPHSPYFHPWYFQSEIQWKYHKRAHEMAVKEYFGVGITNRTGFIRNNLLIMDVTQGDGWGILCKFLGKKRLFEPFPHANKSPEETYE